MLMVQWRPCTSSRDGVNITRNARRVKLPNSHGTHDAFCVGRFGRNNVDLNVSVTFEPIGTANTSVIHELHTYFFLLNTRIKNTNPPHNVFVCGVYPTSAKPGQKVLKVCHVCT